MNNGLCQMASTEFCLSQKDCYSCPHGRKCFKRLAAYEDTGLEPEGVETQSVALAQCKPYIDAICDEHGKMLINPTRLAELAQAEKDGRLVVMPVKEGTKIYRLGYRIGDTYVIEERYYSLTYFRGDVLGETIFLTREEAEAALKKREEADNETD